MDQPYRIASVTHSQPACRGHGADSPLTVRSIPLHTVESQSLAWGSCLLLVYLQGWELNPLGYTVVKERRLPDRLLCLASPDGLKRRFSKNGSH